MCLEKRDMKFGQNYGGVLLENCYLKDVKVDGLWEWQVECIGWLLSRWATIRCSMKLSFVMNMNEYIWFSTLYSDLWLPNTRFLLSQSLTLLLYYNYSLILLYITIPLYYRAYNPSYSSKSLILPCLLHFILYRKFPRTDVHILRTAYYFLELFTNGKPFIPQKPFPPPPRFRKL